MPDLWVSVLVIVSVYSTWKKILSVLIARLVISIYSMTQNLIEHGARWSWGNTEKALLSDHHHGILAKYVKLKILCHNVPRSSHGLLWDQVGLA